jgi:hypothetical protein
MDAGRVTAGISWSGSFCLTAAMTPLAWGTLSCTKNGTSTSMAKKPKDLPPPTVPPCMLFCDGVILEQGTGKTTLVNTFSRIAAGVFPSPPRDLHVYVQLTSFLGDVEGVGDRVV